MKVLVQWTRATPSGWEQIDSSEWANTPFKVDPTPPVSLSIDNDAGWVYSLNIQGVIMGADHYYVEHTMDGGCRATIWDDDPRTNPIGERYATEITFRPLAPDARLGGAINTNQSRVVYAEEKAVARLTKSGIPEKTIFKKWTDFKLPAPELIRHGKQVDDNELLSTHDGATEEISWRQWTEHLPESELDVTGKLLGQRSQGRYSVPSGTMTMYIRGGTYAAGVSAHTGIYTEYITKHADSITERTKALTVPAAVGGVAYDAVSMSGLPGVEWPQGEYRCQIDCLVAGAAIEYGLLPLEYYAGQFCRLPQSNDDSDTHPAHSQEEAAFLGTGLKLATTVDNAIFSVVNDDETDRFGVCLVLQNTAAHKSYDHTFEVNTTDDFVDGPWDEGLDHLTVITGVHTTSYDIGNRWDADASEFVGRDATVLYRSACIFDITELPDNANITKILFETYNVSVYNALDWTRLGGIWCEVSGSDPWTSFTEIGSGLEFKRYSNHAQTLNWAPEYLNDIAITDLTNHIGSGLQFWQVGLINENEVIDDRGYQFRAKAGGEPFRDARIWIYYSRADDAVTENAPYYGTNF